MFAKSLFPVTSPSISKTDAHLVETIAKKRNDFEAGLKKYQTTIEQMSVESSSTAIYEKHVAVYQLIIQLRDNIVSNCPAYAHSVLNSSNISGSLTKAEISSRLNTVRVLSLSTEIAEIIHNVTDKNSSMTEREFTTKVEQLAKKAHYLPGYGNDLLVKISTELGRLAIVYICLSAYLFLYTTLSHAALIAATAFLGIAVILLGICIGLRYLNQKKDIVDNLFCIIDHLKYNDLKFDGKQFELDDSQDEFNYCRYTASGNFTDSTVDLLNNLLGEFILGNNQPPAFSGPWRAAIDERQVVSEEVSSASESDGETDFVMVAGDKLNYDFASDESDGCLSAPPNYSPDFFSRTPTPKSGSPVDPDHEYEFVGGGPRPPGS